VEKIFFGNNQLRLRAHCADKSSSRIYAVGEAAGPASAPLFNEGNKMTTLEVRFEGRDENRGKHNNISF
jgi:hypothetical protein